MATDITDRRTLRSLDLTGLPEPLVRHVEQLVSEERQKLVGAAEGSAALPLPPDQWRAEMAAWKRDAEGRADRYPEGHVLDDSRDTIYGDRDRV